MKNRLDRHGKQPKATRTALCALIPALVLLAFTPVFADEIADHLVISEVLPRPDGEQAVFIEIYNPTKDDISLDGYFLKAAHTGSAAYLNGVVPAHGFYLVATFTDDDWPRDWVAPDYYYDGLEINDAHGGVVLNDQNGPVDALGWGSSTPPYYEGVPCDPPAQGDSLERKSGDYHDDDLGNGLDTGNNLFDCHERGVPEPQNSDSPIEVPPSSSEGNSWSYIKSLYGDDTL